MTAATHTDPKASAQLEIQARAAHQGAVQDLEAGQAAEKTAHASVVELERRISVGDTAVTAEAAMAARIAANRAAHTTGQLAAVVSELAGAAERATRVRAEADARALASSARSMSSGIGYQQVLDARQAALDAQARYNALRTEWDGQVTQMGRVLTGVGGFDFRPVSLWKGGAVEPSTTVASRALQRLQDQRDALLASIPGVYVYPQGGFVVDGQVFTTREHEAKLRPGDLAPNPAIAESPAGAGQDLEDVHRELSRLAAEIDSATALLYRSA